MRLVEIKNLTVGYGDDVILRDVNISIAQGDFIGIIGPNGGGKTTFIKALLGLLKPFSGKVLLEQGVRIGYLPQRSSIDRQFPITVTDVICSGDKWHRGLKNKAQELLGTMGMDYLASRTIAELSGGEMQRVLLCRALISDPQLLILDEPTAFVDNKFEKEFYQILWELNKNMAIVMVSHDLGTITQYVKTIVCINRSFHYHPSNVITAEQLRLYDCPLQLVRHGDVPHTVLLRH